MTTSRRKGNGIRQNRTGLRRLHRWLGVAAALFVLMLAVTGIALNHGSGWGLDKRYVTWSWLLDSYGVRAPGVSASYTDRGYRATLLATRLYLGEREIAADVDGLTGMVSLGQLLVITSRQAVLLFTTNGELVERMPLPPGLSPPVERVGRAGQFAVIAAGARLYRSDSDISNFTAWENPDAVAIDWSLQSSPAPTLINVLQEQYRGRGLTIERIVADIHSGRIVGVVGPSVMDAVGVLLITLSLTGLLLWRRPRRGRRM